MEFKIAVLPGDGVGPEVVAEGIKVLEAAGRRFGHSFELEYGRVGGNAIDDFGTALPDETIEICNHSDAILFGAVGGPKWDDPRATVRPEDGILAIRKNLGLFANLRPVKVYPALINSSPIKPHLLEGVDMIVLGTHGRTGLSRLLMGSVAEAIVRRAKCPVLSYRKPAEATADA